MEYGSARYGEARYGIKGGIIPSILRSNDYSSVISSLRESIQKAKTEYLESGRISFKTSKVLLHAVGMFSKVLDDLYNNGLIPEDVYLLDVRILNMLKNLLADKNLNDRALGELLLDVEGIIDFVEKIQTRYGGTGRC